METFSALLASGAENSPVPGEFPAQRPVMRSFDVFFDLRLNHGWVNNREAGDLRRYRAHDDVTVLFQLPTAHANIQFYSAVSTNIVWNQITLLRMCRIYFEFVWYCAF